MASKSQTFEIVLTANGSAVTEVMDELKNLAKGYATELDKLTEKKKQGIELTKEEEKYAESLTKKIQGLNTAWERNAVELRQVDVIMKDLAQATGNEMGRALKTLSARFKRAKSDAVDDLIKIKEQMQDVRHEMSKREGIDALKKAKATLTDLANTPLDKLKMGLESIEKKLSTMSEAEKRAAEGMELLEGKRRYQAQIAVTEYGPVGNAPLSAMSDEQLRDEQQRLRNLYMGTDDAKGYEGISQDALTRLHEANKLVKDRADAEREAAKAAKDAAAEQQRQIDFAKESQRTQQTLANLEKASYEDLKAALKHLEAEKDKIQSGDTLRTQHNLRNQERVKKKMKEMEQTLLSDKEISRRVNESKKYNVQELQEAYDQLQRKLMSLASGEKTAALEIRRQMKSLKKDIEEVNGESSGLMKIWKTAVRNIATYIGVFAGFNMVKSKIMEVMKSNLQLSDSIAQVQKVTGLTRKEVDQLNRSFEKLDTRTALTQLNELAYSAGKMGLGKYGVEGIQGFVNATNQLQVALGDDLGNSVDEAITPLAKLAENLGLIQKMGVEKSMMAIGSSINELSQTTTAVGANIVDFARRVQPAAQMIGLTADQILALGSAADSFGVSSEIAATAFTKFLAAYRTNTAEIEKILNMVPGTLDQFFDKGKTMDGLLAIFQRMHDIGDLRYLQEAFKALGSEGSRMFTTFGAFSKNVDMFREHLATSTQAFAEATSVTREYELVQNTAAGIMERANNIWEKAFVNPEGVDMVKEMAVQWYNLSQQLTQSESFMWGAKRALESIATIAGILIRLLPILVRAMFFYGAAAAIKKLTVEYKLLDLSMKACGSTAGKLGAFFRSNIWVLAATAIGFAVTALIDMAAASDKASKNVNKLSQEEQDLADAQKMVTEYTKKEVGHLDALYKAATDTLQPMEKRVQWVQQLKQEFPDYFKDLSDEAILTGKAANQYEALAQSLIKAAKARAYKDKMEKISEESVQLQEEIDADLDYLNQNENKYKEEKKKQQERDDITSYGGAVFAGEAAKQGITKKLDAFVDKYEEAEDRVLKKQAQIGQNDQRIKKLAAAAMENTPTPKISEFEPGGGGGGNGGGGGSTSGLSKTMANEQQKAKAIIDNIKNYYQRQMNAVREMANNMDMTEGDTEPIIRHLEERLNTMLSNARMAIGGEKNQWEEFKGEMISDLYEKTDNEGYNFSLNLLNDVMENDLKELRGMILELSKTLNKRGDVLLDQILRKATEDEGKNIKQITDQRKRILKELLEKNYTGKVDLETMNTMEDFGIGGFTSAQSEQFQKWATSNSKEDADAAREFFRKREEAWYEAFENARKNIAAVIMNPIEQEGDEKKLLAILFGENYEETLKGNELEGFLDMSQDKWKVFYQKLLDYNDQWTDAQKKAYDEVKKRQDYLFNNRADVLAIDSTTDLLTQASAEQNRFGEQATFGRQIGTVDNIQNDPELMRLELLQARAEMYYNRMAELRAQDLISEEQLKDAKDQMTQAQIAMQNRLVEAMQSRTSAIQNAIEPVTQFAEDAGQKLGDMIFNMESQSMTWEQIWKKMVLAMAKSVIQMGQQYLVQKIQRQMFNAQMEADETTHQSLLTAIALGGALARMEGELAIDQGRLIQKTVVNGEEVAEEVSLATILTALGISEGAAKTIGSLGWWGIPLIAVISSLLLGLLSSALSTAGAESSKSTAATKKVKLASGMLTYDEGNVQTVVGNDGRVYRAREQRSLPSGVSMVTEPIATTVNGQQALVGERGPEIVIGRKTTRAIQMNRPDLLRDLALIDRGITTRKIRTFDEGNIQDLASAIRPVDASTGSATEGDSNSPEMRQTLDSLSQTVAALSSTVLQLQKNGIPAKIQKYGKGGLIDEVQSGLKFESKYK